MGFSRNSCTISLDPETPAQTHVKIEDFRVKLQSLLYKMIWGFAAPRRRRRSSGDDAPEAADSSGKNSEYNKAWLLADSGGGGGAEEPHTSFRFSLCSEVELESMADTYTSYSSAATVLMVNLDNGFSDSKSAEMKWRRIESLERSISPLAHSLIRFNYSQIRSATGNFSKGRVLGRGALSCVFRGRLGFMRATTVAIKRLDKEDNESSKAFCRELMIASSLHNQYIVPLVGFCIDSEEGLFLVYRYVSGGSLDRFLHGKKRGAALSWSVRYKVAVGIAEAIEYLHNGTERCVVHRDIKPSNILLSSKKMPKLCDFGLASWTPAPSIPFLCTTVKGTFGYLAPEYFQHGKVSDKTDVYAFGVVLLELITGRKPIESKIGSGEQNLVLWAKPLLQQGCLEKLLDQRPKFVEKNFTRINRMVQAAASCIKNDDSARADMKEILAILRGEEEEEELQRGLIRKKKAILAGNSNVIDYFNPQLKRTKSEMKSHFALAMMGVEFEDDTYKPV
ncbi:hypothetical protein ACP275_12G026100 [Erythranthe tilingii]